MTTLGNRIGLALSGGGHRATVFALGALLYLVDSRRNKDVTTISSVSGGSLTNAFLATLPKAFSQLSPEEFDQEAARFACQIAGDLKWWRISCVTYLILFVAWGCYTLHDSPVRVWSLQQVFFLPPVVAWAVICGPKSKGTLWAWWGSWLYVGVMAPAVSITLAMTLTITVWWSWGTFALYLCLVLTVFVALYCRSKVAELAFDATICARDSRRRIKCATASNVGKLADLPSQVRHVFCATEAHSGRHAYFTHDLIYAPYFGLGEPGDFRQRTAVQVSANFPGAFPFRLLKNRANPFTWIPPISRREVHTPGLLALTDGGVYDNTGASWYLEADDRPGMMQNWPNWPTSVSAAKIPDPIKQRILAQIEAMRLSIDKLMVINASMPPGWRAINLVPGVAELFHLLRVTDALYNNKGIAQINALKRTFLSDRGERRVQGCLISIDETPSSLAGFLGNPEDFERFIDHTISLDKRLSLKAEQVRSFLQCGADFRVLENEYALKKRSIQEALQAAEAQLAHLSEGSKEYRQQKEKVTELKDDLEEYDLPLVDRKRRLLPDRMKGLIEELNFFRSRDIATTFRPLGREVTADLLYHGYLLAMTSSSIMFDDFPVMEPIPKREDFHALAMGKPRANFPKPVRL